MIFGCTLLLQTTIMVATPTVSLDFDPNAYMLKTLSYKEKTIQVRAYENIIYVQSPIDTQYQILNVYVPVEYYEHQTINGYTANTAPIFFPNLIGGYMPSKPLVLADSKPSLTRLDKPLPPLATMHSNASLEALKQGFIVVSAGARGRTLHDEKGVYTGKAPAGIVDLKAAIRYLHYNDTRMLGDATKIISNGTSAGGALSALLGASGNHQDYEPYLKTLGAANAKDDIFAVSAYCPITNLEHADMAYEWLFSGITHYKKLVISGMTDWKMKREEIEGDLTLEQQSFTTALKALFPTYVNHLGLKKSHATPLMLDTNGEGSFKEYISSLVIASAQKALDKSKDMSSYPWLYHENNRIIGMDFDRYIHYMGRMKTPPAFDTLDLSGGENTLFGTQQINSQHFSTFGQQHDMAHGTLAQTSIIKMMNPMEYIDQKGATIAKYWRIRHGTIDKDTSLAIPALLATKLQNSGLIVDFELAWDQPHGGDYDLDELFAWANTICH